MENFDTRKNARSDFGMWSPCALQLHRRISPRSNGFLRSVWAWKKQWLIGEIHTLNHIRDVCLTFYVLIYRAISLKAVYKICIFFKFFNISNQNAI